MAEHVGYSPFHFTRLFTAAVKIPPGKYLTALRLHAAKRLLLEGTDAVIDVATAVGFDSLSSFSRAFRQGVGLPPGGFRRLAEHVADAPVRPFSVLPDSTAHVRIRLDVPDDLRPAAQLMIWVGWFPHPAPFGLPTAGRLVEAAHDIELPLCPGSPWLLAFAVARHAEVGEQLAPSQPLVALHPMPITAPGEARLRFQPAPAAAPPLLSALPSLRPAS